MPNEFVFCTDQRCSESELCVARARSDHSPEGVRGDLVDLVEDELTIIDADQNNLRVTGKQTVAGPQHSQSRGHSGARQLAHAWMAQLLQDAVVLSVDTPDPIQSVLSRP